MSCLSGRGCLCQKQDCLRRRLPGFTGYLYWTAMGMSRPGPTIGLTEIGFSDGYGPALPRKPALAPVFGGSGPVGARRRGRGRRCTQGLLVLLRHGVSSQLLRPAYRAKKQDHTIRRRCQSTPVAPQCHARYPSRTAGSPLHGNRSPKIRAQQGNA